MSNSNMICQECGKEYSVCLACAGLYSWKRVACSPECYKKLLIKWEQEEKEKQEANNIESENDTEAKYSEPEDKKDKKMKKSNVKNKKI